MLRRILLLGNGAKTKKALEGVEPGLVQVVEAKPGEPAPPGTVAILGDAGGAEILDAVDAVSCMYEETLNLLAEAIDCRESFAPGNSVRVRKHATRFAEALGLEPDDRSTLERGALVRDIGKLRLDTAVLLKEGLLTVEEWDAIHQHTHFGGDIVRATLAMRDTEDVVRRHHECWDGTGYPDGLEREQIPYLARAMKLLDVYCAMTSFRPYRDEIPNHHEAIDHIEEEKGKHFDPELAQVFVDAFGDTPLTDD